MATIRTIVRVALACLALIGLANTASASLTLTTGLGTTSAGNLVTNGSFEIGTPPPAGGGSINYRYWGTGTTLGVVSVPTGWTSSGGPNNYAVWGNDGTPALGLRFSDALPDGNFALYFGNSAGATVNLPPTFNPDGSVTFSGTPTVTPPAGYSPPVMLTQTVPTVANPAPFYRFSFWVSGEDVFPQGNDGMFGLRVTNVLAGDPVQYLTVPGGGGALGNSHVYEYTFTPINPLQNVDIEFYNYGHFNFSNHGGPASTTELVLDHVIVNVGIPEPASLGLLVLGGVATLARRRGA